MGWDQLVQMNQFESPYTGTIKKCCVNMPYMYSYAFVVCSIFSEISEFNMLCMHLSVLVILFRTLHQAQLVVKS